MRDRLWRSGRTHVIVTFALCATVTGTLLLAPAQGASETEPLELRRIMRELGANMQIVTDAVSREDWPLAAQTARKIANHNEPPLGEKLKILSFLGSDAVNFRGADQAAHEAATIMAQAASKRDRKAVIAAFAKVQSACLSCHAPFRKRFLAHFYGPR